MSMKQRLRDTMRVTMHWRSCMAIARLTLLGLLLGACSSSGPANTLPDASSAVLDASLVPDSSLDADATVAARPRMLLSAAELPFLKDKIDGNPTLTSWYQEEMLTALELLNDPPVEYSLDDRGGMLMISREALRRIKVLAFLFLLEEDERFLTRAKAELDAVAEFPDWNPAHFLDTAEMSAAVAIGYDWLHGHLSEGEKDKLEQALVEKGLTPAYSQVLGGTWFNGSSNWVAVCNGGIGLGALAVQGELEEHEEALAELTAATQDGMRSYLASLQPSGATAEGPVYWGYGLLYATTFLAAVEDVLGTTDLEDEELLRKTGLFGIYQLGPARFHPPAEFDFPVSWGLSFNFSDSGAAYPLWLYGSFMQYLGTRYAMPVFNWFASRDAPETLRDYFAFDRIFDLIWHAGQIETPEEAGLPLDAYFAGAEVVSWRSSWDYQGDAIYLGFKGGRIGDCSHEQLDLGTFVLDAYGERLVMDLGSDEYNLPGYFDCSDQRWDYYRNRAEGHNTLVINPGSEPDQNLVALAPVTVELPEPSTPSAEVDLTNAYQGRGTGVVVRSFQFFQRRTVTVQDDIVFADSGPHELYWFVHTEADIELSTDALTAYFCRNGVGMTVQLAPSSTLPGVAFFVSPATPLPLSPAGVGQNPNTGVQKLGLHAVGLTGSASIEVVFHPTVSCN